MQVTVQKEEKNKKRGMLFAIFFHVVAIGLGLYPFLIQESLTEELTFVEVNFEDFKPMAANSARPAAPKAVKEITKKPVKVEKPKPKPTPRPKPVLTTPDPEPIKVPEVKDEPRPEKIEIPTPPVDPAPEVPEPEPTPEPDPEPVEEVAEEAIEASEGAPVEGNTPEGTGSDPALEDGQGTGETGTIGTGWADEGEFNRRVLRRADIKKLVKESGKIVIKLCINQEGRVTFTEYDRENSSIKDKNILKQAAQLTSRYRFERDYTAAKKQCGRLTYIVELDD